MIRLTSRDLSRILTLAEQILRPLRRLLQIVERVEAVLHELLVLWLSWFFQYIFKYAHKVVVVSQIELEQL